MDFGIMGVTGPFAGSTISYDPVSDFGTDEGNNTHSTSITTMLGGSFFSDTSYYGTYIKDGKLYSGEIKSCGPVPPPEKLNGYIDALDTFRFQNGGVSDRNISTKIAAKPFNLEIVSLNEDQNGTLERSGVDIRYNIIDLDTSRYLLSQWGTFDAGSAAASKSFRVNSIHKNAAVAFQVCADFDVNSGKYTLHPYSDCDANGVCPDNDPRYDGNMQPCLRSFRSSDNFAIRPDRFVIDASSVSMPVKAGNTFSLRLEALDGAGNPATGYNESISVGSGASPTLSYADAKPACQTGSLALQPASITFADGVANVNLSYDEVGRLVTALRESASSEFASVDRDDTDFNATVDDSPFDTTQSANPVIYRSIKADVKDINFSADHFDIQNPRLRDHHQSPDVNFTYLAIDPSQNQLDPAMASKLSMDITAKNKSGAVTQNYNSACYAKAIDLNISYAINGNPPGMSNPGILSTIYYRWLDDKGNEYSDSQSFANGSPLVVKGSSSGTSLPASIFNTDHNGTAKVAVQFNFDRDYQDAVDPFTFSINDIVVRDTDGASDIGTTPATGTATYLYARTKPSQYLYDDVTSSSIKTPVMVVVYCGAANCPSVDTANGRTNEENWWLSTSHDMSTSDDGNISLTASSNGTVSPSLSIDDSDDGIDKSVTVTHTTGTLPDVVSVGFGTSTSDWLIYNPDSDSIPNTLYKVRFVGTGTWSTTGNKPGVGKVVGGDIYKKKAKRVEW